MHLKASTFVAGPNMFFEMFAKFIVDVTIVFLPVLVSKVFLYPKGKLRPRKLIFRDGG